MSHISRKINNNPLLSVIIVAMLFIIIIYALVAAYFIFGDAHSQENSDAANVPVPTFSVQQLSSASAHEIISNRIASCVGVTSFHYFPQTIMDAFQTQSVTYLLTPSQAPNRVINDQEFALVSLSKIIYTKLRNYRNIPIILEQHLIHIR